MQRQIRTWLANRGSAGRFRVRDTHERHVLGGTLWACTASGFRRAEKSTGGGAGVRHRPQDGQQDAALFGPARISAQPIRKPKLGPWLGGEANLRSLARRAWFTGGYTVVKDYLRLAGVQQQEMYVPLSHAPGEAQAGFGEPTCWVVG